MAIGTQADFKIYSPQFFAGVTETLQQKADAFNAGSNGAIRLVSRKIKGEFEIESFFKNVAGGLIRRRDPGSVASVADKKLEQGEFKGVKVNRGIGPVAETLDAFRKVQMDSKELSLTLGMQMGPEQAIEMINSALTTTVASLTGIGASVTYDCTGLSTKTLTTDALVGGLAKFGDAADRVRMFAMHSKNYFDLVREQIASKIFELSGVVVYGGSPATLNRPVIVLDSPSLFIPATSVVPDTYSVLGLVEGACEVAESEDRYITSQEITGLENLVIRIQGEYAYNLSIKGCAYNTASGANPSDAALASSANWPYQYSDRKSGPGIRIKCQ